MLYTEQFFFYMYARNLLGLIRFCKNQNINNKTQMYLNFYWENTF